MKKIYLDSMTDKALIVNLIGYKNKEKRNDGEF